MRIQRVAIENWRSIRKLELDLGRTITIVQGPNESGKSTVQEAIRHAFLVDATSTASELNELIPWGSSAKAHVELTFETSGRERFRIVKSFPKGEARLYTDGDALLAEGRGVQERIFESVGIPSEAADLFALLWIDQGAGLDLFGRKRTGGPLAGPSQTLLKSIIKENLLSGRTEELLRELKKELGSILQQNGRARKGSPLGALEQREAELAGEAEALAGEIEETERRGGELERIEAEIAGLQLRRERETTELARLERKHEAQRELEPKATRFEEIDARHGRLLAVEAKEQEAAKELPGLVSEKLSALEEWLGALDERRVRAQELHASVEKTTAKLEEARVTDRRLLDELDEQARSISEARVRLEASKLTVRVTPDAGAAAALRISSDEGDEETVSIDRAQEWSAMRSVRLKVDDRLAIECFGPLSREDWGALTKEIAEGEELLAGRLETVGCKSLAEAKAAFDAFASLQREKARLDRELASFLGPGGEGLEREIGEANAAQQDAGREVERLAKLGIDLDESAKKSPKHAAAPSSEGQGAAAAGERLRRVSSRVSVAIRDIEESRREREEILDGKTREELTKELFALKDEVAHARAAISEMKPVEISEVSGADLKAKRGELEAVAEDLTAAKEERTAIATLQSRSSGALEKKEEIDRELTRVRTELGGERTRVDGIVLLIRLIEEEKEQLERNILEPFEERLTAAFRGVSGERYGSVALGEDLGLGAIAATAPAGSVAVDVKSLSYGTREQLSFLFRLLVAQYLSTREPQVMMLDDTFVNTDAERRERLFEMMSGDPSGIQFILFTCHAEAYEAYRNLDGVRVIDMAPE